VRIGITDFAQEALGDVVYVRCLLSARRSPPDSAFGEVEVDERA